MKWDNKSLPAIIVVMWRWSLDSDGLNNHENQPWIPRLLITVLGSVPLVLIIAVVSIIESFGVNYQFLTNSIVYAFILFSTQESYQYLL